MPIFLTYITQFYHVSLGLHYLHSERVVHGDLKVVCSVTYCTSPHPLTSLGQLNILIDDSGKAVLCDFSLSRMRVDMTSHSGTVNPTPVVGSRNWMAPERLSGQKLRNPCDIYSFGMTIYEGTQSGTCRSAVSSELILTRFTLTIFRCGKYLTWIIVRLSLTKM